KQGIGWYRALLQPILQLVPHVGPHVRLMAVWRRRAEADFTHIVIAHRTQPLAVGRAEPRIDEHRRYLALRPLVVQNLRQLGQHHIAIGGLLARYADRRDRARVQTAPEPDHVPGTTAADFPRVIAITARAGDAEHRGTAADIETGDQ